MAEGEESNNVITGHDEQDGDDVKGSDDNNESARCSR